MIMLLSTELSIKKYTATHGFFVLKQVIHNEQKNEYLCCSCVVLCG